MSGLRLRIISNIITKNDNDYDLIQFIIILDFIINHFK